RQPVRCQSAKDQKPHRYQEGSRDQDEELVVAGEKAERGPTILGALKAEPARDDCDPLVDRKVGLCPVLADLVGGDYVSGGAESDQPTGAATHPGHRTGGDEARLDLGPSRAAGPKRAS